MAVLNVTILKIANTIPYYSKFFLFFEGGEFFGLVCHLEETKFLQDKERFFFTVIFLYKHFQLQHFQHWPC